MFRNQAASSHTKLLLMGVFAASLTVRTAVAQSAPNQDPAAQTQPAKPSPPSSTAAPSPTTPPAQAGPSSPGKPSRFRPTGRSKHATNFYRIVWGVDAFGAKAVESGEMIRFSYRILDPEKAEALNDKHNEPALFDERANVKLVVPSLEKVGLLRQSTRPEAGKVYWMVFSNKERYVKRGDRVSVVIGKFRVDGLLVE